MYSLVSLPLPDIENNSALLQTEGQENLTVENTSVLHESDADNKYGSEQHAKEDLT